MCDTFINLTELGRCFGLTSHQVGKKLKEIGLRLPEGKPSPRAFNDGLVEQRGSTQPGTYYWVWHADRTTAFLVSAGCTPVTSTDHQAAT